MSQVHLVHKSTLVDPKKLVQNTKNAAKHPESQLQNLAKAFRRFGFIGSVTVGSNNVILAGHGRVEAAIRAGMVEIPVIDASHLSQEEQDAYVIAENKLGEQKLWDDALLKKEIDRLSSMNFDFAELGISQAEMNRAVESALSSSQPGEGSERKYESTEDERWETDEDHDQELDDRQPSEPREAVGAKELDQSSFENFMHQCPRCNFEFDGKK